MTKLLAPLAVDARSIEHDLELQAIAARLSETASYAVNPSFKEELREACLCQLRDHRLTQAQEDTTGMSQSQAAAMHEQTNRQALILSYLNYMDSLLRK